MSTVRVPRPLAHRTPGVPMPETAPGGMRIVTTATAEVIHADGTTDEGTDR